MTETIYDLRQHHDGVELREVAVVMLDANDKPAILKRIERRFALPSGLRVLVVRIDGPTPVEPGSAVEALVATRLLVAKNDGKLPSYARFVKKL